tara:strand:+ start:3320 stop:4027 length:708 start_codon:yes stop_codon:yes gene_type:complete
MLLRLASPKRVLRFIGSGLALLSVARVLVLVIESYSQVRNERLEDEDLMNACDTGIAAQSADFRALCLRKRAERAAPVLLKALLRACTVCFTDFCESMSSPTKIVMLVLFCLTGIAAPVVKALAQIFVQSVRGRRWRSVENDSGSEDDDVPEIALLSHSGARPGSGASVLRIAHGLRRRLAHSRADRIAPVVEELPPSGWDSAAEAFYAHDRACLSGRPMPSPPPRLSRSLQMAS